MVKFYLVGDRRKVGPLDDCLTILDRSIPGVLLTPILILSGRLKLSIIGDDNERFLL
jgi:hypothetical protein